MASEKVGAFFFFGAIAVAAAMFFYHLGSNECKTASDKVLIDRTKGITALPKSSDTILVFWQLNPNAKRSNVKEIVVSYCSYQEGLRLCNKNVMNEISDSVLLRNLQPFTTYEIYVVLRGTLENEEFSNTVMVETLATAPSDPPKILRNLIDTSENTIQLEWTPPEIPNGVITHYFVHVNDKRQRIDAETGETKTTVYEQVIKLKYLTNYEICVQACVQGQCSGKSKTINFPSAKVPDDLTEIVQHFLDAEENSVHLEWSPPAQHYGLITHYFVNFNGERRRIEVEESDTHKESFKYELKELKFYTKYVISVQSCILNKCSKRSEPIKIISAIGIPEDRPQIQSYSVDQLDNSLRVEWSLPRKPNGPISHFNVQLNTERQRIRAETGHINQGTHAHVFRHIKYDTKYIVSVQACVDEHKCSMYSVSVDVWSAAAWPPGTVLLYAFSFIIGLMLIGAVVVIKFKPKEPYPVKKLTVLRQFEEDYNKKVF